MDSSKLALTLFQTGNSMPDLPEPSVHPVCKNSNDLELSPIESLGYVTTQFNFFSSSRTGLAHFKIEGGASTKTLKLCSPPPS